MNTGRHSTWRAVALASLAVSGLARADIYTWVDAQGRLNVSNLSPPEGARVTSVVRETPPRANPYNDAAREAAQRAEMEALAQRVEKLQGDLDLAARQPPPQPQPQYVFVPVAAPMQYAPEPAPAAQGPDCGWYGWNCNVGWGLPIVAYVYAPPVRHRGPPLRDGHGGRGNDRGDRTPPRRPPTKPVALIRP